MTKYPPHLQKLIQVFKKLPGVGSKSAERFAFHCLSWTVEQMEEMASTLKNIPHFLKHCEECGCLVDVQELCHLCDPKLRDPSILCIVAHAKDVFAVEQTHEYKGLYHVLGGHLSPLEGRGPEHLSLSQLEKRISHLGIQEIIIALDSTLEGDATALYIKEQLVPFNLSVFRLAFGLPMGSALEYVDGGTLARALRGRLHF